MIDVGHELPVWRIESVSSEAINTLAAILRDPNPIHLDAEVVKELGLGDRVINQGPANLGYVLNMLQAALPGLRISRMEARFTGNVFAGDTVVAGGRVTSVQATGSGWCMDCDVWLDVVGRGRVLGGAVAIALPGPSPAVSN